MLAEPHPHRKSLQANSVTIGPFCECIDCSPIALDPGGAAASRTVRGAAHPSRSGGRTPVSAFGVGGARSACAIMGDVEPGFSPRNMRPKAFDQTQALDAAMMQFWESGYEGSSMQALVDRMKISRQSLYDTYGNKRELFESALERYHAEVIEPNVRALKDPAKTPWQAVRDHLEAVAADRRDTPPGCLVVRTATELPVDDRAIGAMLEACLREIRDALEARIEEGRRSGVFDPERPGGQLAASVLAAAMGLQVMSRLPGRGVEIRPAIDTLMAGLGPRGAG